MIAITCELCGSNDIQKQDGVYVCQHCGTKYTLEEAKKLLGTVRIDTSERTDNLFQVARQARMQGDYVNAERYYSEILTYVPDSWEANYYSVQCKVNQSVIAQIASAANMLSNATVFSLQLIKNDWKEARDNGGQDDAITEVGSCTTDTVTMLFNAAMSAFMEIDWAYRTSYREEFLGRINACLSCLETLADTLQKEFPNRQSAMIIVLNAWISIKNACKNVMPEAGISKRAFFENKMKLYERKIEEYTKPKSNEPQKYVDPLEKKIEYATQGARNEKSRMWTYLFAGIGALLLFIYFIAMTIEAYNYADSIGFTVIMSMIFGGLAVYCFLAAPKAYTKKTEVEAYLKKLQSERSNR